MAWINRRPLLACLVLAVCVLFLKTTVYRLQPMTRGVGDLFRDGHIPIPHRPSTPKLADAGASSPAATTSSPVATTSSPVAAAAAAAGPMGPGDAYCAAFPDVSNIMLIMNTGASEVFHKVPTQLQTTLRCLPNTSYAIMSGLDQMVAGVPTYDPLVAVLLKVRENHRDFEIYRVQRACPVDVAHCLRTANFDVRDRAWTLDKYMNNHMAARVWRDWPRHDWYFFVDADTFVFWGGLVRLLQGLNPDHHHYIGAVTFVGSQSFAHGGSGYLISRHTMEAHAEAWPKMAAEFDERAESVCCGDFLHGDVLRRMAGIEAEQLSPSVINEKWNTLTFYQHLWCHPLITLHHLNAEGVSALWTFEVNRSRAALDPSFTATTPPVPRREAGARKDTPGQLPIVLAKDIYHALVAPQLRRHHEALDDWDNGEPDVLFLDAARRTDRGDLKEDWMDREPKDADKSEAERRAHESFQACRAACVARPECLQFKFREGVCVFKRAIKLGEPAQKTDDKTKMWRSGWILDKIEAWVEQQDYADCEKVWWPEIKP